MIKRKPKKCRGTGKATGCGCGETKWIKKFGLCEPCYIDWLLKDKRGKEYKKKITLKVQAPRKKAKDDLEKLRKEIKDRKSLSYLINNTKNWVHKYVKLRDKGKPCISCKTLWRSDFHAGHYFKAELYPTLRFNFNNINGQCPKCNNYDEGNLGQYALNLAIKIGKDKFLELQRKAELSKQEDFKWDREELEKIRQEARRLYYDEMQKR